MLSCVSVSYADSQDISSNCKAKSTGEAESFLCMAKYYFAATNPNQNPLKALKYAMKSAKLGNANAMAFIAYAYEGQADEARNQKNDIPRDCKKSQDWYKRAAALGNKNAIDRINHEDWGFGCDF